MVVLVDVDVSFNSNHHGVGKACDHDGISLAQNRDLPWTFSWNLLESQWVYGHGFDDEKHGKNP